MSLRKKMINFRVTEEQEKKLKSYIFEFYKKGAIKKPRLSDFMNMVLFSMVEAHIKKNGIKE